MDISEQRSRSVDDYAGWEFGWVVTVCDSAGKQCPSFPGRARRVHVGFDDSPRLAVGAGTEEEALEHYRRVRDEIRALVERMPASFESPTEEVWQWPLKPA